VPGASNTCAAIGPVAWLRLRLGMPGVLVHEPLAASPKFQRYSSSWKGRLVAAAVVAVASKNTYSGATPDTRLGTSDAVMSPAGATVTVALCEAPPPAPVQLRA
jgi:hypothetical protein